MENLVDKIIEINRLADEKVKAAEKKKEETEKKLEAEKQQLISEIETRAKEKLEHVEQAEKTEADSAIKIIRDKLDTDKQNLQKVFNEGREMWVQHLVNKVLDN